jgi:hypothetical protein
MFETYETFVIGGQRFSSRDDYYANRDSVFTFDKNAFLSDQPDTYLPFLAAFLETQMFASMIDAKIISQWEPMQDDGLATLDARIAEVCAHCAPNQMQQNYFAVT